MFDLIKTLQNNSAKAITEKKTNLYNNTINLALNASKEGRNFIKLYREQHSILEEIHYDEIMKRLELEGFKVYKNNDPTITGTRIVYTISWRENNE